jgi:hypothetical protein
MRKHTPVAPRGATGRRRGKRREPSLHGKVKRMTELEQSLIQKASEMHSRISPCPPRQDFEHCFTRDSGKVYFWFNTEDKSTHVVMADAKN